MNDRSFIGEDRTVRKGGKTMLPNIKNLREISRRCQTGQPLDPDLAVWLGSSLEKFLEQRCHTVDEALGLRFAQGGVPWWREEAIRLRDEALRALAQRVAPGGSTAAKAKGVYRLALRYAASAWRFDREREAMPATYFGTPNEMLWRAFKSGAAMPLGERQLRTVLAGA
jgi:hypothetical protein